jgi:hypothetical protein
MGPNKPPRGRESRMERAIQALLEQPTSEKAATSIGISYTTLWRWMQQENFKVRLHEARRQAYDQSTARLQQASSAAVGTLLRVMTDPTAPVASKVRAADLVLVHAAKAVDRQDILDRISDLEKTIKKPEEGAA